MATVLLVIIVCATAAFFCLVALGWEAVSAREYLIQAAALAQQRKYDEARKAALVAVHQHPAYKTNPDVQILYEIIMARSTGDSADEIERIRLAIPQWPKTKWERMVAYAPLRIVLIVIIVIGILLKIAHF